MTAAAPTTDRFPLHGDDIGESATLPLHDDDTGEVTGGFRAAERTDPSVAAS